MRILLTIVFISILTGCSSTNKSHKHNHSPKVNHFNNLTSKDITPQEKSLINAAQSIEKSLETLAKAQTSEEPALIDTKPLVTPEGGMGARLDIDWTGPIAPLLYKLGSMTNYELKILGNEPSIPVIVTLTKKQAVIADIVKNASLQARNRASVVVFPENKIIELRYKRS